MPSALDLGVRIRRFGSADEHETIPLISKINERLWMGGCQNSATLPDEIKHVISLYPWEAYDLPLMTSRFEYALHDKEERPEDEEIDFLSTVVLMTMARGVTLVHCQAGLNRSALVVANAMRLAGGTVDQAIETLRNRRSSMVLSNKSFEAFLRSR